MRVLEQLNVLVHPSDPRDSLACASAAQFHIAECHALSKRADEAMAGLKKVVAGDPRYEEQAAQAELLQPLHFRKDFKALVGG